MAELMIAVMIAGIVLTAMLRLMVSTSFLADSATNLSVATFAAQSKIDEIQNDTYSDIVSTYDGATPSVTLLPNGSMTVHINEIGDDVTSDLLSIVITVNWTNRDRRAVQTTLTGYVAQH